MKARLHVYVSGRVQGVFFRAFAKMHARSLGLNGWARNCRDGRVEVLVEGERDALEELIQKLKIGPPAARVDDLDIQWEEYRGDLGDFRATY